MGFKANEAVDPLDFSFKPYADASGTIPEPTADGMEALQLAMRDLFGDVTSEEQVAKTLAELSSEELRERREKQNDALVTFCGGAFTREDLDALPLRVFTAFNYWLQEQLGNPLPQTAATRPSPAARGGGRSTTR